MSSMLDRVVFATSASELPGLQRSFRSITAIGPGLYEDSSADPATKYLVTFEMTIKPLPEEPSISDSHPLTDGLER